MRASLGKYSKGNFGCQSIKKSIIFYNNHSYAAYVFVVRKIEGVSIHGCNVSWYIHKTCSSSDHRTTLILSLVKQTYDRGKKINKCYRRWMVFSRKNRTNIRSTQYVIFYGSTFHRDILDFKY
jgi:hypothetical protein